MPIPKPALWLGGTGAIPFVALSVLTLLASGDTQISFSNALLLYGAIILSFLGGVHWGLAIAHSDETNVSPKWLALSIVPALIGWGAMLLGNIMATASLLALGFAVMLIVDMRAARVNDVPAWYIKLRWPLTVTVVLSLLFPIGVF